MYLSCFQNGFSKSYVHSKAFILIAWLISRSYAISAKRHQATETWATDLYYSGENRNENRDFCESIKFGEGFLSKNR